MGASWVSCQLEVAGEDTPRQVILSAPPEHYPLDGRPGACIGRYANRIANGRYTQAGKSIELSANEGNHCLHGGRMGFSHKIWQISEYNDHSASFIYESPDGEEGFPGSLTATVTYYLRDDNAVIITYGASCEKPTICNLSNHVYFNLDGRPYRDVRQHRLQIAASHYLPVDDANIPSCGLKPVEDTPFDFRETAIIAEKLAQTNMLGYDHSFLLNKDATDLQQPALTLTSSDNRVHLQTFTNKPAVQVYTGNQLKSPFSPFLGIALETQFLPDTPNHSEFPRHQDCFLHPGKIYRYQTIYRLQT